MERAPVIVSACLLGLKTRYDGGAAYNGEAAAAAGQTPLPLCPEQLGGLSTPRAKAEICGGGGGGEDVLDAKARVIDEKGTDVTEGFLRGARLVAAIARVTGARTAILKEKSPSCGVTRISRDGSVTRGVGVTAALLKREGIHIKGF